MSRYVTLEFSDFAIKNHRRSSGNSYTTLSNDEVIQLVLSKWNHATPGNGETDLSRKILVPIPAQGFFCPPRAPLVAGMQLQSQVKFRQEGEDPYVENFVAEEEARRLGVFAECPATKVEVVCYSAEALLENNGKRSSDCSWELVTFLATEGKREPMAPLTMARNFLEAPGGTKGDYSAQEFAESIYHWASKRGVKVLLEETNG